MLSSNSRPVIIVTGANTGVGFGICQRLLSQLSAGSQQLASNELELDCDGLTLILACRSKQRAEAARAKLCSFADEQVRNAKRSPDYNGHAERFRRNLHMVIHTVDLANIQSVFHFADEIGQNYPYVSHLICNAGVASFTKIVWSLALQQLFTNYLAALSRPNYFLQGVGDVSRDGLGWVWQCNVFGHYALFRALERLMSKYTGARVIWISSHEASSKFYDPKDWQLVKSEHSYHCSKYQMNMVSLHLDREAVQSLQNGTPAVRHFIAYPGVARTSIASALLGPFSQFCFYVSLYIARFLGSQDHPIEVFKAAISAVYLSLIAIPSFVPNFGGASNSEDPKEPGEKGIVYVSKTDWWGHEFVGTTKLVQSQEEEVQTRELLENFDRLMKTFCDVQGRSPDVLAAKN